MECPVSYVLFWCNLEEQSSRVIWERKTSNQSGWPFCSDFNEIVLFLFWFVVCLMVFNATFNNISVISWRSVLLVEETTNLSQVTDKLYHIILYTSPWSRFELTTSVVIGTDCIGSCKSNYHTIATTTAPVSFWKSVLFHLYSHTFSSIFTQGAPMCLRYDLYRVWYSMFYSKLFDCIFLAHLAIGHVSFCHG